MINRSRTAALVALAAVGFSGLAASSAVGRAGDPVPAPIERVHRYYAVGPSAEYEGDSGGIGQVDPVTWQTPAEADQTAVAEISFQYRTRGRGPFVITFRAGDPEVDPGDDGDGGQVWVRPRQFELGAAPRRTATTVRFLAPALIAGTTYEAYVGVNSVFPGGSGVNVIRTRKMLVTVELSDR